MRPLSVAQRRSLEEATAIYEKDLECALSYLEGRGISRVTAERFRLGVVVDPISGHDQFIGRLSIPAIGREGQVYSLRFRAIGDGDPKYLGIPGVPTRLFNIRDIHETQESYICVTEGEIDSMILSQCGLPAVGVTGASAWKKHHARMLSGFSTIFVFGDGDKAGQEFNRRVSETLTSAVVLTLPGGSDVNDLYLRAGKTAIDDLIGDAR